MPDGYTAPPLTDPVVVWGDLEAGLADDLRARLNGTGVSQEFPGNLATRLPWVTVARIGGGVAVPWVLDEATVDVEGAAATRQAASDLTRRAVAIMAAMRNVRLTSGLLVTQVRVDVQPTARPDPARDVRRFGASITLLTRPS